MTRVSTQAPTQAPSQATVHSRRSTIFALGLVVLAALAARPVRDITAILTLEYGSPERRIDAAHKLGEWRATSAIPALLQSLSRGPRECSAANLTALAKLKDQLAPHQLRSIAEQLAHLPFLTTG